MKLKITDLNHEGFGVARFDNKAIFIADTIPEEVITAEIISDKKRFSIAKALQIEEQSPHRVMPKCAHFADCGGCSWQYISSAQQVIFKEKIWLNQLQRLGNIIPEKILPAIDINSWRYRNRARFSWDGKNFGFKAKNSHQVINIDDCWLLPLEISAKFADIKQICHQQKTNIKALEIYYSENANVLFIKAKNSFTGLLAWAEKWRSEDNKNWQIILETKTREYFPAEEIPLSYHIDFVDIDLPFTVDDFTQVNQQVNNKMLELAHEMLNPAPKSKILDAFSGLGNFAFTFAKLGAEVVALEGSALMVQRGQKEALHQNLNIKFEEINLFDFPNKFLKKYQDYSYCIIDPPRAGAQHFVSQIGANYLPQKILYISCDSGTLARDAKILSQNYKFVAGRVLNMFPQTSHIESMNLFELII